MVSDLWAEWRDEIVGGAHRWVGELWCFEGWSGKSDPSLLDGMTTFSYTDRLFNIIRIPSRHNN